MAQLDEYQQVCEGALLESGGNGIRFHVMQDGSWVAAFVIRFDNQVYGYLNRCAHQAIELDWNPGEFFDKGKQFLVCATHGAVYEPDTGNCVSGRCNGRGLTSLETREVDGTVYVRSNDAIRINGR